MSVNEAKKYLEGLGTELKHVDKVVVSVGTLCICPSKMKVWYSENGRASSEVLCL